MKTNFLLTITVAAIATMTSCKDEILNEKNSTTGTENEINTVYPSTMPLSRGTISEFETDWEDPSLYY